jgi:hypothetical protein
MNMEAKSKELESVLLRRWRKRVRSDPELSARFFLRLFQVVVWGFPSSVVVPKLSESVSTEPYDSELPHIPLQSVSGILFFH